MRKMIEGPTLRLMLRDLAWGPASREELQKALRVSQRTIVANLKEGRRQELLHLASWTLSRGRWTAIYKQGKGKDAPRPPPFGNPERVRRYRRRMLENMEKGSWNLPNISSATSGTGHEELRRDQKLRAAGIKPRPLLGQLLEEE